MQRLKVLRELLWDEVRVQGRCENEQAMIDHGTSQKSSRSTDCHGNPIYPQAVYHSPILSFLAMEYNIRPLCSHAKPSRYCAT